MIPAFFVRMESFPLNANGKIDVKALPEPFEETEKRPVVVPKNAIETGLADIWEKVLGIHNVSVLDHFFYVGGDSLNALKVQALVKKNLGFEISPRDLFRHPTIRELGEYIGNLEKTGFEPIRKIETAAYYPVSSEQKRQFLLNKIDGGISYNQPGGLKLNGIIDADKIRQAFCEIIRRHETLRTSFKMIDDEPVQIVHEAVDFDIEHKTVDEAQPDEDVIRGFVKPFDLSRAPLIRVQLISFGETKHVLLFDMHLIISDGTSAAILVREFVQLYNGACLPELTIQYRDYTAWQSRLLQSERFGDRKIIGSDSSRAKYRCSICPRISRARLCKATGATACILRSKPR
jgi:acyl carrier protein